MERIRRGEPNLDVPKDFADIVRDKTGDVKDRLEAMKQTKQTQPTSQAQQPGKGRPLSTPWFLYPPDASKPTAQPNKGTPKGGKGTPKGGKATPKEVKTLRLKTQSVGNGKL